MFAGISAGLVVFMAVVVTTSILGQDAVGAVGGLAGFAICGVLCWQALRTAVVRTDLTEAGVTTSVGMWRRTIPWSQIARTEVDDVVFPRFSSHGPCLLLVLTSRKRVRLWATERWSGTSDDRFDHLNRQAEQLRQIRREFGQ